MAKPSSHQLEITIISAEDLRINQCSIKKNAFVTIKADSTNHAITSMDTEGGSYPSWNEKLHLSLPHGVKLIQVDVQCKIGSGIRIIGTASIPVSDFLGDYFPGNYLHFLSYRLRERSGERNGIINLSIRTKDSDYAHRQVAKPGDQLGCRSSYGEVKNDSPSMLFPSSGGHGFRFAHKNSGGVAMGIPVSNGYPV